MELEICLKNRIYDSIITTYPDNCYEIFKSFFTNQKIYSNYSEFKKLKDKSKKKIFKLLEISNNRNLTENEKLRTSLDLLYLSDTLKFLVDEKSYYDDAKLINLLYENQPQNFNELKIHKGKLCSLRNNVAHYNYKDYEKKREKYIKALIYFEIHLGCSLKKLHELPKLNHKPNVNEILKAIYQIEPELFNKDTSPEITLALKDRRLCELYDDLAIINGWQYNELKSHWTIIRNYYAFKSKLKTNPFTFKEKLKAQLDLFRLPNP